jgi:hypothetical protein
MKRYKLFLQYPCGYEFGSEVIAGSSAFGDAQGTHNIKGAPLAAEGSMTIEAPARAASTLNELNTYRATLSQSYCAARARGSRKMKRRIFRRSGPYMRAEISSVDGYHLSHEIQ